MSRPKCRPVADMNSINFSLFRLFYFQIEAKLHKHGDRARKKKEETEELKTRGGRPVRLDKASTPPLNSAPGIKTGGYKWQGLG